MKSIFDKLIKALIKGAVKKLLEELKEKTGVDACESDGK